MDERRQYVRHFFQLNPIRKSEEKYYKGEVKGKRTPHGIPKYIWKEEYQIAKKNGYLVID